MSPSPTTNPVSDDRLQAVLSDCGHLAHRLAVMLEGVHGRLDGAPEIGAVDAAAAQPAGLFALAFDTRSTLRGAIEAMEALHNRL